MVIIALYQNDVQSGGKRILIMMVKYTTRIFKDKLHLSSVLSDKGCRRGPNVGTLALLYHHE